MPIRKKLSAKLRAEIKAHPSKFRKKELAGDALTYLNRVRGAAKARKIKLDTTVKISNVVVSKNTEIYSIIEAAAASHKMTPAKFVEKYPDQLKAYIKKDKFYVSREAEYLKADILKAKRKVYVNGIVTDPKKAKYYVTRMKNKMVNTNLIYNIVIIEHYYDAAGNLHITIPLPYEYAGLDEQEVLDLIENDYDNTSFYYNK